MIAYKCANAGVVILPANKCNKGPCEGMCDDCVYDENINKRGEEDANKKGQENIEGNQDYQ